jgi:hypothetical protein
LKKVTEQVAPSRFVDDLLQDKARGAQWIELDHDSYGFKELIAGCNLPACFSASYSVPSGFDKSDKITSMNQPMANLSDQNFGQNVTITLHDSKDERRSSKKFSEECMLREIEHGFNVLNGRKGFAKNYSSLFRSMLRQLGILRGTAIVLMRNINRKGSVYALYHSKESERSTKALSRCTARELGQYLAFILRMKDNRHI